MTTPANLLGGTDTACETSFALPFSAARPRAIGLLTVTSARVERLRLPCAAEYSNWASLVTAFVRVDTVGAVRREVMLGWVI